jgi:hypothetical protein
MGTQTRQKRNDSSNWKSTEKLWSLLLPLQGLRWRTSGTNVKGHSSESASSLLFTEVTRGFLMKAAQKKREKWNCLTNNNGRQENGEPHEQGSLGRSCSTNHYTSCRNNERRHTEHNEIETSEATKCEFVTSVLLCQFSDQ